MENIAQNITIVGSGTQGAMLAFRSAAFGKKVCLYDQSEAAVLKAFEKIKVWFDEWVTEGRITPAFAASAYASITAASDLKEALKDADLVIENVPEILELKQSVWADIDAAAPEKTLLTTNSSSLKASDIGKYIKRQDRTFNVNFMTPTKDDQVEVMWNANTSQETKDMAIAFLKSQKNIPIVTAIEIKGFSLNRVWRAIKKECLKLWANGYISPEDFDRVWMLEWGTPYGPFGLMDIVGLDIIKQIEMSYYNDSLNPEDLPPAALDDMIAKNWLGVKTGKGFYDYPNPAYEKQGWLKGENNGGTI